jgi:hypothetical protein
MPARYRARGISGKYLLPQEPIDILAPIQDENLPIIRHSDTKTPAPGRAGQHYKAASVGLLFNAQRTVPTLEVAPILTISLEQNERPTRMFSGTHGRLSRPRLFHVTPWK